MTDITIRLSNDIKFTVRTQFLNIIHDIQLQLKRGDDYYNILELMDLFDEAKEELYCSIKNKIKQFHDLPKNKEMKYYQDLSF